MRIYLRFAWAFVVMCVLTSVIVAQEYQQTYLPLVAVPAPTPDPSFPVPICTTGDVLYPMLRIKRLNIQQVKNTWEFLGLIQNNGPDHVQGLGLTVTVFDANGVQRQQKRHTLTFSQVLARSYAPFQVTIPFVSHAGCVDIQPTQQSSEPTLVNTVKILESSLAPVMDDYFGYRISGTIRLIVEYYPGEVEMAGVFYDAAGKVVAVQDWMRQGTSFEPDGTSGFVMYFPYRGPVASYEVLIKPFQP